MDWFLDVGGILPNLNITFRKPENFTTQLFYINDAQYPQFLYLDTNFLKALQLCSSCSWLLKSHPTAALKLSSGRGAISGTHRDGALTWVFSGLWREPSVTSFINEHPSLNQDLKKLFLENFISLLNHNLQKS